MRILIYGAGVIGSIFAGKLGQTQNDITVLARGKRLDEIKKNGIILVNPKSKKREAVPVNVIEILREDDLYDYIIVVVQGTQIDEIIPVIEQNCSKNIVFIVNTAGGHDKWIEQIGMDRLMIGFPSAGGERIKEEVHYFVGKGIQRVFQTTTFGESSGVKSERVQTLIHLFRKAGIPSVFCQNMDAWQKTHVALVTNIANALYGFDCNANSLGHSYKDVRDMIVGIKEGRNVLKNCGIEPTPRKLCWFQLPTAVLTFFFYIFLRTTLADITMARHCIVAKKEMIFLQQEFDVLIEKSGVDAPTIKKLKRNLDSDVT